MVPWFENDVKAEATKPVHLPPKRTFPFENDVKAEATKPLSNSALDTLCLRMM